MLLKAWILTAGEKWSLSAQHLGRRLASACSSISAAPDSGRQHPWEHGDSFTHAWALPPLGTTRAPLLCVCSVFSPYVCVYPSNKALCRGGWGGSGDTRRRADLNTRCLCARLGAALGFPKHSPIPTGVTGVLLLFYRLHTHHSIFFARIWGRLFFFPPKAVGIFSRVVCVFSAHSSFQTHKCPPLPGYGGERWRGGRTAQLDVPAVAGGLSSAPCNC